MHDGYLTTGEIAKICSVSKVTVIRWINNNQLKSTKLPSLIGKAHNRIKIEDYNKFAQKYGMPVCECKR